MISLPGVLVLAKRIPQLDQICEHTISFYALALAAIGMRAVRVALLLPVGFKPKNEKIAQVLQGTCADGWIW
ncbi:MAG: hypothetical protein ABJO09_19890 [Hyphomicrobiales bacterium]